MSEEKEYCVGCVQLKMIIVVLLVLLVLFLFFVVGGVVVGFFLAFCV